MNKRWCWCVARVVAAAVTGAAVGAPPDPRIDEITGRSQAKYAPDRLFDHRHMRLEIAIADIEVAEFSAVEMLRVAAIGMARGRLELDAGPGLVFSSVTVDGAGARFAHAESRLRIELPAVARPGVPIEVVIRYRATAPGKDGNGLNWFPARKGAGEGKPPSSREYAQVYSQGESEWNHLWFACHDSPNEKLTTELVVSAPAGYAVVSNGQLMSKEDVEGGLVRWHWRQEQPHTNYLVMLAIGRWDVVELGGPESARPGLEMPVYARLGTGEKARELFANTPEMVRFFEAWFDEPYPWEKYAQVQVRNFRWGGMENTSATTLAETAGGANRGDQDDLIAHELAHQWLGNLVTCKTWEHTWLNEGWATLAEWLWIEHRFGRERYLDKVEGTLNRLGGAARGRAPESVAMASRFDADSDAPFVKADDPYAKGGLVLHMLRERLGEAVFQRGAREYIDRYRFGCVETDDLRRVFEEVSGQSLERFFWQWVSRPGLPEIATDVRWDEGARELVVLVEQRQRIDADNPAYALRVPVWVRLEGGTEVWFFVDMETTRAERRFGVSGRPVDVKIDPHVACAARKPRPAQKVRLGEAEGAGAGR